MNMPDPCGSDPGFERIVGIYIKFLQYGVNYTNKDGLRAQTLVGYANAIRTLFDLRGFRSPVDPSDPTNTGGILIINHKREEDIAAQRYPLTSAIFVELGRMATHSHSPDSERCLLYDVTCLSRFIGPRVSEYAQTSPTSIDYHVYPSGKKVIKAFIADDFTFYDKAGDIIEDLDQDTFEVASKMRIIWRIQKNRQNGQSITLSAEPLAPQLCPVRASLRMIFRSRRLGQPDFLPVACHLRKKKPAYLTGKRVAALFRLAAKTIHPKISKADLKRYSAHSLRVWACVLLDEAGATPEFIKSRLRWMGNSFRMYLRDTGIIQDKHRDILRAASQEIVDLIASVSAQTLNASDTDTATVDINDRSGILDETMGVYDDDMD